MDYQVFAERTEGKSFDELLHEGKRKAHQLLEDQGIASVALYVAEMMARAVETSREIPLPKEAESALS